MAADGIGERPQMEGQTQDRQDGIDDGPPREVLRIRFTDGIWDQQDAGRTPEGESFMQLTRGSAERKCVSKPDGTMLVETKRPGISAEVRAGVPGQDSDRTHVQNFVPAFRHTEGISAVLLRDLDRVTGQPHSEYACVRGAGEADRTVLRAVWPSGIDLSVTAGPDGPRGPVEIQRQWHAGEPLPPITVDPANPPERLEGWNISRGEEGRLTLENETETMIFDRAGGALAVIVRGQPDHEDFPGIRFVVQSDGAGSMAVPVEPGHYADLLDERPYVPWVMPA